MLTGAGSIHGSVTSPLVQQPHITVTWGSPPPVPREGEQGLSLFHPERNWGTGMVSMGTGDLKSSTAHNGGSGKGGARGKRRGRCWGSGQRGLGPQLAGVGKKRGVRPQGRLVQPIGQRYNQERLIPSASLPIPQLQKLRSEKGEDLPRLMMSVNDAPGAFRGFCLPASMSVSSGPQ